MKIGGGFYFARIIFIVVFLGSGLLRPTLSQGQTQAHLIINEVAWMGTFTSANDEWLELYNPTDQEIDLSGWSLKTTSGSLNLTLSNKVVAQGYFLLERTDDNSVPELTADQIYTGALSNGGDKLELFDATSNLIDSIDATAGWPAGDNETKATLERKADETWQTSANPGGTPKAANSTGLVIIPPSENPTTTPVVVVPTPATGGSGGSYTQTYSPNNIIINEFLADPLDGQEEWLELYNTTGQSIDLTGWLIEDGSKGQTKLTGNLSSQSYLLINKISGNLNNSGDLILLKSPTGETINQVVYGDWNNKNSNNASAPRDGQSAARKSFTNLTNDNLDFIITTTPTPGQPNQFTLATTKPTGTEEITKGSLVLNELLANPLGDDSQTEFIELKNNGQNPIDLAGWRLQNTAKNLFILSTSTLSTTTLAAGKFLTIYRSLSQLALDNNGDTIKLYDVKNHLIDSFNYKEALENISWSRDQFGDWELTKQLTPDQENIILLPVQTPQLTYWLSNKQPLLGETVTFDASDSTNPTGGPLNFWWDFGDGQTSTSSSPLHIFYQAKRYTIKLKITNNQNLTTSKNFYLAIKKNTLITEEESTTSGETTTNSTNPSASAKQKSSALINTTLEEVKALSVGQNVSLTGVVSVLPGVLGQQIFYLTGSPGIQIYCYKKDFPELILGDKVFVTGQLAESGGEKRIKIKTQADIRILSHNNPLTPEEKNLSELDDEDVGSLLTLTGQVIENTKTYFQLANDGQELKVYLKPSANLDLAIKEGDQIRVTGILSKTATGLRLLPRTNNDLVIEKVLGATATTEIKKATPDWLKYLGLGLFLLLALALWLYNRKKSKNLS
ncbi:MAG: lamin tail domain-containing protein [Candidatus Buchananbacteria bacterium]